jgi:putative ABC transport system permease protein
MQSLWRDLRFATRMLLKSPGFTIVAIFTLALGIGATTVIFSVADSILLAPYPYKDQDRTAVIFVHDVNRPTENGRVVYSVPEFMDLRDQNHVFENVTGMRVIDALYTNKEGTLDFDCSVVTYNRFDVLGAKVLLGRAFTASDDRPGAPTVFVMSDKLWASQFNRDPSIVGSAMTLNGESMTLLGIVDRRYLPNERDIVIAARISEDTALDRRNGNAPIFFQIIGIQKRGVSASAASADFDVILRRRSQVFPQEYPKQFTVMARPLTDLTAGPIKGTLYLLMAAVTLLLLIACSNVANLLLARATAREREIAIRASMGASRGRLIHQLLVESFILAAAGCLLGILMAYFGLKGVASTIPRDMIPTQAEISLHPVVLWFALGITFLTTALCGLAPAIHAVRGALSMHLTGAGKGAQSGSRHGNLRGALVIAEVALSILLLGGAGLMMRTLFALERQDLGFSPSNILVVRLPLPKGRYDTPEQHRIFFDQVLTRVKAVPGVVAATATTALPPYGGIGGEVTVPGKTHSERWTALVQLCSENYFQTLGLQLLRGRLISESEAESARYVAVVNQTLARHFFGDDDPIGRTIKFNVLDRFPYTPHDAYFEIIGVTRDARNNGIQNEPLPEAFVPYSISGFFGSGLLVKTTGNPLAMLSSVRQEIWAVDRNVPLTNTGSLEGYLERYSYSIPKFGLLVIAFFAGIGLMLVIIGVFGVMAYTVSLQTHEIGIRMALGAQHGDILKMVLLKGLRLTMAGIVIGLLASLGLSRLMAHQIWGVSATDPLTLAIVVAVVVVVGAAACFLPARRATHVDPLVALRYE